VPLQDGGDYRFPFRAAPPDLCTALGRVHVAGFPADERLVNLCSAACHLPVVRHGDHHLLDRGTTAAVGGGDPDRVDASGASASALGSQAHVVGIEDFPVGSGIAVSDFAGGGAAAGDAKVVDVHGDGIGVAAALPRWRRLRDRGSSQPQVVRRDAGEDLGAACARRVTGDGLRRTREVGC